MFLTYKGRNNKDTDSTAPKQIKDWLSRAEQMSAIISAEEVAAQKGAGLPKMFQKRSRLQVQR